MANFNLDRIRFRWKGDWTGDTAYTKDDIVYYNGKAYVCLIGHTSNTDNLSTDLNDANSKWELMFDGKAWKNVWTSETYYTPGDIVKFKGYVYECVTAHTSTIVNNLGLPADISNWKIVATTYNWLNEWTIDTYYDLGDVVRNNGIVYICSSKHQSAADEALGLEDNQPSWTILTTSDSWQADWETNTRYVAKDIVKYGAISYRCLTGHTSAETLALGLEEDQNKWEIFVEGIEYKGDWTTTTRYKKYDIVKSGSVLWRALQGHTSTTTLREDQSNWEVYIPGLTYESLWESATEYKKGDIVLYGGYTYTALTNNLNSVPSVNGILQDTGDWELLVAGYTHLGDWSEITSYKTGNVIRDQGYLYIAVGDSTAVKPNTDDSKWQILVTGRKWKKEWTDNTEYHLGDVVTYAGTAYICINEHLGIESDNRPDLDIENTNENYWRVLLQGTSSNVLTSIGDLRTHDGLSTIRNAIGNAGSVLSSSGSIINWQDFEVVENVFYVSIDGIDESYAGKSLNTPFRTVKYACEYVLNNVDTNTTNSTIFIKTGIYEEILPIKVPRNCALVGDELRSTVITPAAGYETSHMFFVNNGSGIRNMTLQGLSGDLPIGGNEYNTRLPTGGAYVSLDPGTGSDDESVWITNKSCYVQNVTAFGTACVGMKIDGSLHDSGNKSIVANDFTQVISDGIGYWALNGGRSELVSVFTYFCYIGYFAQNGGILRATNGNNSYGTYGSRAEGFSLTETPITAEINNQTLEAQVDIVHTNGNELIAFGYEHAGQNYTSATGTIAGTGINANVVYEEYRDNAISQIRLIDPSDSSTPGGINYQYLLNNAQGGDTGSIILAASDDTGTPEKYIGMRIVIVSGKGVGQYGYISGYNETTKVAIISKEYNDTNGWENLYPGRPIETELNSTTRYSLEPRVIIDDPGWTESTNTLSWPGTFASSSSILSMAYVDGTYIAVNENGDSAISTNGTSFVSNVSDITGTGFFNNYPKMVTTYNTSAYFLYQNNNTVYRYNTNSNSWSSIGLSANQYVVMAVNTDIGNHIAIDGNASLWQTFDENGGNLSVNSFSTIGGGASTTGIAYGNSTWVVIKQDGKGAYSTDNGNSWTESLTLLPINIEWDDLTYGNGRFVAVGRGTGNEVKAAYSFDGITWYNDDGHLSNLPIVSAFFRVVYQNGQFLAWPDTTGTQVIARSKDGYTWKFFDEDSTQFTIQSPVDGVYALDNELWNWNQNSNDVYKYASGAGAVSRVAVSSSRIQNFTIYDPGSNYTSTPGVLVFDNENTIDALDAPRIFDGVLPQPVFTNRGEGYVTATAEITGDGFADIYQTGKRINLKNVSLVPGPGANVVINGINDINYRLTKIVSQSGTSPNFDVTIEVSPPLTNENSPDHNETLILRELYSQVRLTGHDFLDIGSGNTTSTAYPQLYLEGYVSENEPQPFNEVTQEGGGRVFYTSTDQDGNFRVGELFAVEQATGVVSINADFFELSGLEELSLGGVQLGGSAVVIREFSKEPTFAANSNNIVPTEAAIQEYLQSRISGGGADAVTNTLFAGQVKITGSSISTTSGLDINIPVDVDMTDGIDGDYLAQMFFASGK